MAKPVNPSERDSSCVRSIAAFGGYSRLVAEARALMSARIERSTSIKVQVRISDTLAVVLREWIAAERSKTPPATRGKEGA